MEYAQLRSVEDPINKRLICLYSMGERDRMDNAIFSRIEKVHPTLEELFTDIRSTNDPIMSLHQTKKILSQFKQSHCLSKIHRHRNNDKTMSELYERVSSMNLLLDEYIPAREEFYLRIADTMQSMMTKKNIGVKQLLTDTKYYDEMKRLANPSQIKAAVDIRTEQCVSTELLSIMRMFTKIMELEKPILPTVEAVDALNNATWYYHSQEFARIYA